MFRVLGSHRYSAFAKSSCKRILARHEAEIRCSLLDVFGGDIELVNGTIISKRDAQRVMMRKFAIDERPARAAVSSYRAESWTLLPLGLASCNDALCDVTSLTNRVLEHTDQRHAPKVNNPRKP